MGLKEGLLFAAGVGFFSSDESLVEQFHEGIVHEAHSRFSAGLDDAGKHVGFSFADQISDCGVVGEDFQGEHASCAIGSGDELLGNDPAQRFGDHDADLVTLVCGEDVEDAIQSACGVSGGQGSENQVTRLGGGDGELDGLQVTHFTYHDNVGVFAESSSEGGGETFGVGPHLALGDVADGGGDEVLDGVLEGDDVVVALLVDCLDEGGEGG